MTRLKKELAAWPESKEELLALLESFHRLEKKARQAVHLKPHDFWYTDEAD